MSHATAHNFTLKDNGSFGSWLEPLMVSLRSAPITLTVIAASAAAFLSSALTSALQLVPSDMTACSWQWLTCHLTHWSFDQLFWDVMAFGVLGYLCEQTGRFRMVSLLVVSSFVVALSVAMIHPELVSYRGLSGVDSALFAYLACYVVETGSRNRDRMWALGGAVAWLVFVGKVTFEFFTGQTLFVDSAADFQSVPISHVAGALSGSLVWLIATLSSREKVANRV